MRLKHLTLLGFKTFAPKTDLVLGEGLTAIVGPNGSGKSNIADAVRWALGEQSLSNLRAKRTEDLIFAGSSNRAPLGMAEVSITIDNADRLLPLDFSEVTLTRRAYRSGENEYYINKSRVRLREVLDVASVLGQAYTVVGQGLVDAALSLRPEERRELFEEAAAIRGYFVQREDALRRLTRTEENVARVGDLAAELEPQVRRMERQARQAEDYHKLDAELRALLREWYADRWLMSVAELERAQSAEDHASRVVEARKAEAATKSAELAEARAKVWELVDAVSSMHEQRAQIQARHAAQSQAQAVMLERLSAARLQLQSLAQEQANLKTAQEDAQKQSSLLDAEAAGRNIEMAALEESGRGVAAKLVTFDARISDLQGRYSRAAGEVERLSRQQADLHNREAETQRQRAEQERSAADAETTLANLQQKLSSEEAALEERHTAMTAAQRTVAEAEREQSSAREALATARSRQERAEANRRDLGKRADALASQLASLAGEQQASLYGGVRAVVAAAQDGRLDGYVGTVAELLRVPPDLETAIEAALGGRLQEIAMARWADAERAIAMLKTMGTGRATFLPLDTLRSSPVPTPPSGEGIIGLARDLMEYDPSLCTLAESLLGRLLIVEDLTAARKVASSLPHNAPWMLATLGGEVVRPGGSVTGGSNARADDARAKGRTILARERKRRELVGAQEKLAVDINVAEQSLEEALSAVRLRESELDKATLKAEEARKRQIAAQVAHMEQQGAVSRLQQELSWRIGLLSETRKNITAMLATTEELAAQRDKIASEIAPLKETVAGIEGNLKAAQAERDEVAQSAGASQMRLAVLGEAVRNARSRQEELRKEAAQYQARMSGLNSRLQAATRDEASLVAQLDAHAKEVARLAAQLNSIEARVGPSEREVRVLEAEVNRIETEQSALQAALLESDTQYSRAAVEKQRCMGVLDSLRIEIAEELGDGSDEEEARLSEPAMSGAAREGGGHANPAWVGGEASLPSMHAAPEWLHLPEARGNGHAAMSQVESADMERRVRALKARVARLGPVNPLAMEEHAALSERHTYLRSQLDDLGSAADSLRRVIAELDRAMRDQFAATFAQVNEAFQYFFNSLFDGGAARLDLTNPDDVSASGVELMAQPPGKRMQPLAALSGGERALTSVALLCALLKVRPVPFCVLDEVDAALDESNVTRFRAALKELGDKTQFVVVTHNRGTIEAADTLYGVSMAGDGTSQLLSLRMEA